MYKIGSMIDMAPLSTKILQSAILKFGVNASTRARTCIDYQLSPTRFDTDYYP